MTHLKCIAFCLLIVGCINEKELQTDRSLKVFFERGNLATIDSEIGFKLPHLEILSIDEDGEFLLVSRGYREISNRDVEIIKRMLGVYRVKEYNLPSLMPD